MTFAELVTEIQDRLNYTSSASSTRVGRLVNKVYRQIGTSIGLSTARQTNTTKVVTIGNPEVTFSGTEKILQVWTLDSDAHPTILDEVMYAQLREVVATSSDAPKKWALHTTASNTVTIRLDASPETAYTLYAEVIAEVADLSGSNEPAFSESFHDIIIEGVLKDEYRKLEKIQLARESEAAYERRLSDLRMFIAKSNLLKIRQGELSEGTARTVGSGSAALGQSAVNITALWTFSRGSALAPFAVSNTDALYVTNLGAEFLGNITTDRLIGRDTTGTGETEQLTVGGGVEFTGSGGIQTSAFTGDVTKSAGGTATTIAASAVETSMLEDDAVTFAKMQNIATDRLLGRDTASTGNVEELTVGGGVEFTGSAGIQRSALTGDVTASAGSGSTTIANDVVTYAKIQDVAANSFLARAAGTSGDVSAVALSASQLAGRGSAGDVTAITLGSGLAMASDTLSATASFAPRIILSTMYETSARHAPDAAGAGTTSFGNYGALINTSATATSSATIQSGLLQATNNGGVFTSYQTIFGIHLVVDIFGTDFQSLFAVGDPVAGAAVSYTGDHAGFKIVRAASGTASLYATQADGTTETASSALTTVVLSDAFDLCLTIDSASSISYYWRKNGSAWSSATTLTTNLPDTATATSVHIKVGNNGVATQTRCLVSGFYFSR